MREKLLVLDDEDLILKSLEHLFEDDYDVFTTTEAEKALGIVLVQNPSVILCDDRMPRGSGREFLKLASEISKAARVLMSGCPDVEALTDAVNRGQIFAFVAKPWDPLKLKSTIASAAVHFRLIHEVDQERRLLRVLMESIPDPIYFKDCHSRFIRVNQAHAHILGANNPSECIGKTDFDFFDDEETLPWLEAELDIVRTGQPQVDQIAPFRDHKGNATWMSITKVPMFDGSGQVSGIAAVTRNVTELKKVEEALREQGERRRLIIETANEAFVGIDNQGAITDWNPCAQTTFGWTAEEAIGRRLEDVAVADAARGEFAQGLESLLARRGSRVIELNGLHRDGRTFPVEATIWAVQSNGVCSFNAFLRDITLRRRTEDELKQAKEAAEAANRAKSEFITTMSHEMRTPMNAILGMADVLAESPLLDDQREYVRIFKAAGETLLHLINDILDISKVESGHLELESIGFALKPLLATVVSMLVPRSHGVALNVEILPGVPSNLRGDPNRLRQILLNLTGNALKFTERGSVTLRVEPEPDGAAGWLRFNVIDTGIGIPAEKTEMIFERFTQADSSTTRKFGGTGLGLAISKSLSQLMGGRIGCRSEVGKGSIFFLSAPFAEFHDPVSAEIAAPFAEATLPPAARDQPRIRILIAEDSEQNLVLLHAYLKDSFELDFAENGQVALDKMKSSHPDLVLMDLQMPVMDGLAATRAIRRWELERNAVPIPILALTAHAMGEGIGNSLEAGCSEHLTKPIKKATLIDAILRHVHGKIRITPPEGLEELIPNYLVNVRRHIGEILAAADTNACQVARRLGHQFKGTGEAYGFPEITRTGAAVELAAMSSDADTIRRQILALSSYLDRVEIVA